ncbi:DUF1361 domain-containing protein [Tenacibaculum amylolyticum]|uniref:DUF1361 domain-containing protein n=1 Tax=Tenacibaculum amylolyticum TaxID=104269 RepID=UPI0038967D71
MDMRHFTKTQKGILILVLLCVFLDLLRVQLTQSLNYSFLLWNLFLALIPYVLSEWYKKTALHKKNTVQFLFGVLVWLLFLPNAPYIITDFIHFKPNKPMVWFDLFLLFSFAYTGLLLAIISSRDIYLLVKEKWSNTIAEYTIVFSFFLCGFGIYLGRFLRFNSWDIIASPIRLLKKSVASFLEIEAWYITLGFGVLLWVLFAIFKNISLERLSKKS